MNYSVRISHPLILLSLAGAFLLALALKAEGNFNTDFEGSFKAVSGKPEKQLDQRIDGEIISTLFEDSHWADVEVSYSRLQDNVAEGESAQRIQIDRVASGSRVQLAYRDLPLIFGEDIEISFFGKSHDYTPVTIQAVQKAPPYKTLWERKVNLVAEWKEVTSRIPGSFDVGDTQFMFVISQPGTVDLDALSIQRSPTEVVELSAERKGNLLTNSSFPLGLTSPWIMQFHKPVSVSSETGPTGAPALQAVVNNNNHEDSLRVGFDAIAGEKATVRIHARKLSGEINMALRIGPADEALWKAPYQKLVPLTENWQRSHHTIELPVGNAGYYLLQIAFSGSGVAELDGVQVELGPESQEFKRTAPIELSLKESKYQGLHFEKEPFALTYTAYGDLFKASHLVGTLEDLYGNTYSLGKVPLPSSEYEVCEINIEEAVNLPLGSYRMELTAVDAEGAAISRPSEALLHRVREPRYADSQGYESYFGIHYGTGHLTAEGMQMVKDLGFNWVRLFSTFTWKAIEPHQKGEFHFEKTDRDLEILESKNLMPMAILGFGSPNWARREGKAQGFANWVPKDMDDWSDFAKVVFDRYGDRVKYYEPWNEPYYASFFTGEVRDGQRIIADPEVYFDMHKRTYELAPEGSVILWNTNALEKLERTEELIEMGIMDYTDAVSIHHYTSQSNPKEVLQEQIIKMRAAKGEAYQDIPIWNSEGGMAANLFNLYDTVPPRQEEEHHLTWADWYAKYFIYSIAAGLEKYFPYYLHPTSWWRRDYSFGNVDGRLSSITMSMSNLAWQIDGLPFVDAIQVSPYLEVFVFGDKKRSVAILDGHGKKRLIDKVASKSTQVYDLFGNDFSKIDTLDTYLVYLQSEASAKKMVKKLKMTAK